MPPQHKNPGSYAASFLLFFEKLVSKEAEAYWLFGAILSYQITGMINKHPFQVWRLKQQPDETWKLSCEDGDKNVLVVQNIEYNNFPIPEITIWLVDGVALLPSEY